MAQETLGACCLGDGQYRFVVWAPLVPVLQLECDRGNALPMHRGEDGYHRLQVGGLAPGVRYRYLLGGNKARPDPASRFQPEGVHGLSEVVDPSFSWTDTAWVNPPLASYVFYELHTGTFSTAGTFQAITPRLPYLRDLGITAIELMPVAQFPGTRNWGYDGVFPYAVQNSYGGPVGLKTLVDAAHREGIAVVLDVVYNHLGPEGNYLRDFGPYFTDTYKTPWGDALNFDGPDGDEVRRFFIDNALYWATEFHVDALRLDAIHAIIDSSARPFVHELAKAVHEGTRSIGRTTYVIAESDRNDVRVIQPGELGGLGCDALWNDDFHHALHVLLTGEREGYYKDFGTVSDLATAYTDGFVYSDRYSPFRRRRHGNSARGEPGERFVVCAQNHDQIGNRPLGDRLSTLVDFESLKLAAAAVLFAPYLPLLFMGDEYGEAAPFLYFTSHSDAALIDAVRQGRKDEFPWFSTRGELPDPQDEDTFQRCRLTGEEFLSSAQRRLRAFYRELLRLRREIPALSRASPERCQAIAVAPQTLLVRRWLGADEALLLFHFSVEAADVSITVPPGQWEKTLASSDDHVPESSTFPGGERHIAFRPRSFMLYRRV